MSIKIKKVVFDNDNIKKHHYQVYILDKIEDFPYLAGKYTNFLRDYPHTLVEAEEIDQPLFNNLGYGKIVIDVGKFGVYYLQVRPSYNLQDIIVEPDDVVVDIYYNEYGLVYSFYNSTNRNTITITAKVVEDIEGVYSKISSDPENLTWRQYFIRRALHKPDTQSINAPKESYPEMMTALQVATYLQLEEKTIRNWTSENKISYKKLGGAVRYSKTEIDAELTAGKIGRKRKSKR